MSGKILLLLVIYLAFGIVDIRRLKKLRLRESTAYMSMLLLSLYLSFDYVLGMKWFFLENAASFLFSEPAARIVKLLMVPS